MSWLSWRSLKIRLRNLQDGLDAIDTYRSIQERLPPLNFITIHYAYFIITCMISSLIFWGSSNPARSISYTDSLFLVVSAMTEAGLNTINLSQMTTFQQVILWLLILIGSSIFVSIGTVLARKNAFERRFKDLVRLQKEQRRGYRRSFSISARNTPALRRARSLGDLVRAIGGDKQEQPEVSTTVEPRDEVSPKLENGPVLPQNESAVPQNNSTEVGFSGTTEEAANDLDADQPQYTTAAEMTSVRDANGTPTLPEADHISFMPLSPTTSEHHRVLTFVGVGANPRSTAFKPPFTGGIYQRGRKRQNSEQKEEDQPEGWYPRYLTPQTIGRNGQFFGLSRAEREHLGGVEYRAVQLLSWIVPIYFTLWQLLGCLGLAAYMAHNKASTAYENGINPWYLNSSHFRIVIADLSQVAGYFQWRFSIQ